MKSEFTKAFWLTSILVGSSVMSTAMADSPANSAAYDASCAMCHQRGGVGVKGQFPRLAGRVGEMAASAQGRRFLIDVTLWGMAGKVEVDGVLIIGVMPPFATLSDESLAATLNYIIELDGTGKSGTESKASQVSPTDVAAARQGPPLTPSQVHAARSAVVKTAGKK